MLASGFAAPSAARDARSAPPPPPPRASQRASSARPMRRLEGGGTSCTSRRRGGGGGRAVVDTGCRDVGRARPAPAWALSRGRMQAVEIIPWCGGCVCADASCEGGGARGPCGLERQGLRGLAARQSTRGGAGRSEGPAGGLRVCPAAVVRAARGTSGVSSVSRRCHATTRQSRGSTPTHRLSSHAEPARAKTHQGRGRPGLRRANLA